jgi:hypothetical protein
LGGGSGNNRKLTVFAMARMNSRYMVFMVMGPTSFKAKRAASLLEQIFHG